MNRKYLEALARAYALASDEDKDVIRDLWDRAAMKMHPTVSIGDYEWVVKNSHKVESIQWE